MVLRDASGVVVDSLNYGLPVDLWVAEGYQATSGAEERGCVVGAPSSGYDWEPVATADPSNVSGGRFPDGLDTDSNCTDFVVQPGTSLSTASAAGTANIKVASVVGFGPGQTITIGTGADIETAVISHVGSAGATTVNAATAAQATSLPVASSTGFSAGQTVNIDSGSNFETAVIVSIGRVPGRGGPGGRGPVGAILNLAGPLKSAHAAGVQVAGDGITVTTGLAKAHAVGAKVAGEKPTPGAPNRYHSKRR
jgi:hypothetical protein